MKTILSIVVLWAGLVIAGCGKDLTPEQQVRDRIKEMEGTAEARKGLELAAMISQDYQDRTGRTAKEVRRIALGYLMANQSVHLLVRVRGVRVDPGTPDRAGATVLVGMLGQQESDDLPLPLIHADLYRFEVEFRKEAAGWEVIGAEWRPATQADLIE